RCPRVRIVVRIAVIGKASVARFGVRFGWGAEIPHLQLSQLLALYGEVSMLIADFELTQRTALIVEITHDRRGPITAAAYACAACRVIALQQLDLGDIVHVG